MAMEYRRGITYAVCVSACEYCYWPTASTVEVERI